MCGDTHGQFYDLLNIFETFGYPSETNPYLFNGGRLDRGSNPNPNRNPTLILTLIPTPTQPSTTAPILRPGPDP